jgi:transcriptional regulator with AAA-type ATPase domain
MCGDEREHGPVLILLHESTPPDLGAWLEEERRVDFDRAASLPYLLLRAGVFAGDEAPALDLSLHVRELREARDRLKLGLTTGPILLEGETGTGKTRLASALHQHLGRKGELYALNCASLDSDEASFATLFNGVVKGRYSGVGEADSLFSSLHGGTLLLDEFQELTVARQARLLNLIEPFTTRVSGFRVGDHRQRWTADVQIIVAINEPLAKLRAEGRLRRDIHHRLWRRHALQPLRELLHGDPRSNPAAVFQSLLLRVQESALDLSARAFEKEADWRGSLLDRLNVEERSGQERLTSRRHSIVDHMRVDPALLSYRWEGNFRELAALSRLLLANERLGTWTGSLMHSFQALTAHAAERETEPQDDGEHDAGAATSARGIASDLPKRPLALAWLRAAVARNATVASMADALCVDVRTVRKRLSALEGGLFDYHGPLSFMGALDEGERRDLQVAAGALLGTRERTTKAGAK